MHACLQAAPQAIHAPLDALPPAPVSYQAPAYCCAQFVMKTFSQGSQVLIELILVQLSNSAHNAVLSLFDDVCGPSLVVRAST